MFYSNGELLVKARVRGLGVRDYEYSTFSKMAIRI